MGCSQSRTATAVHTGATLAPTNGIRYPGPEPRTAPLDVPKKIDAAPEADGETGGEEAELRSREAANPAPLSKAEVAVVAKDKEEEDRHRSSVYADGAPIPASSSAKNPRRDSDDQQADRVAVCSRPPRAPRSPSPASTSKPSRAAVKPRKLIRRSSSVLEQVIEDRNEEGDLAAKVVHIELPGGKPIEEVYDGVHTGRLLGKGVSGEVRLVAHRSTGVRYAVKCLDLANIKTQVKLQQLRDEIYIMCQLDHPNIVRLEEVYESVDEEKIYLVQELCTGRELFDRLEEQTEFHYTEARCAQLIGQMLSAVRFIHSKGIVHRDLKLENFLFLDESPDAELRMIDFGLSKHFTTGEAEHDVVGTPYTVAPEVIKGSYDERCDLWAIGVIAYLLLCGETPFGGCNGSLDSPEEIRRNILSADYSFEPSEVWDGVSDHAKDFIRSLLVIDPKKRLTAEQAQKHPWQQESFELDRSSHDCELNTKVVESLLEFRDYNDMQKLLCEVLSFTLLPDQIESMRREFKKLDADGMGEISLNDFKLAVSSLDIVLSSSAGRRSSLRPLTEEEIESVFDAMRQHHRATEERIHWHEFVAAGLCMCSVDERNIKLAFDRLDSDHKGYISFDNILDLSGGSSSDDDESGESGERVSEDEMRKQWGELTQMCRQSPSGGITYEDFRFLMDKPNRIRCADHRQVVLLAAVSSAIQS